MKCTNQGSFKIVCARVLSPFTREDPEDEVVEKYETAN